MVRLTDLSREPENLKSGSFKVTPKGLSPSCGPRRAPPQSGAAGRGAENRAAGLSVLGLPDCRLAGLKCGLSPPGRCTFGHQGALLGAILPRKGAMTWAFQRTD